MKNLLSVLLLTLSLVSFGQYPINEEFDPGTTWTFTNGAGIQNYGGAENYGTTNIGLTPYPNSATVTITSPVHDLTDCVSGLSISFYLSGIIENGYDFMYFEYFNGGTWTTVQTFTGVQNALFTYTIIPNTATQFRFRLVTNATVNTYTTFPPPQTNVYYYDITYFNIDCMTVLPIELVYFDGFVSEDKSVLLWTTFSELNNDYFTIERSQDGYDWEVIGTVDGAGNSSSVIDYRFFDNHPHDGVNYYKLKQTDYDGRFEYFDIISVKHEEPKPKELVKIVNMIGQTVDETYDGVKVYVYSDGTTERKMVIK